MHRLVLATLQVIVVGLTAGVIIGYGQLYPLLTDAGIYHSLCSNDTDSSSSDNGTICDEQKDALGNMFEIGAALSIFLQGPGGFAVDFIGPKITGLLGLSLLIAGSILFAEAGSRDGLINFSFQLLSSGGPFIFLSGLPTAGLFEGDHSGTYLMFLNGAYGGGALVFFLFDIFVNRAGVSLRAAFWAYAVVLGVLSLIVLFLWPMHAPEPESATVLTINSSIVHPSKSLRQRFSERFSEVVEDARNSVPTWSYLYITVQTCVMLLKSNFTVATMDNQLNNISLDNNGYVLAFGLILPFVGIAAGPMGIIMDRWGASAGMICLYLMSAADSALGLIHSLPVQPIRFVLFSVWFPYLFAVWSTAIVQYYGPRSIGTLFGIIAIIAGAFNFLSNPMLTYGNSSPTAHHYNVLNIVLLCVCALVVVPLLFRVTGTEARWIEEHKQFESASKEETALLSPP